MKRAIVVPACLLIVPYPEFAVLLFFLCIFWENLGDLTLRIYDDHQLTKTEKALKESMSANVNGYYVHMLTMRSVAERERRNRSMLARKRMIKAVYTVSARASAWVRQLIERGETGSIRAATGEE